MRRQTAWLVVVGIAACTRSVEPSDSDAPDGYGDLCCCSGMRWSRPSNLVEEVSRHGPFGAAFIFDESDTAYIALVDLGDAPGDHPNPIPSGAGDVRLARPVLWSDDGAVARVAPAAPLRPFRNHILSIDYSCDKSAPLQFSTVAAGPPAASGLVGATLVLDGSSVLRFGTDQTSPAGAAVVAALGLRLTVRSVGESGMVVGLHTDGVEDDPCSLASALLLPTDHDPVFVMPPAERVEVPLVAGSRQLSRVSLSGAWTSTGIATMSLTAELRGSDLAALRGVIGPEEEGDVWLRRCGDEGAYADDCATLVLDGLTAVRVADDGGADAVPACDTSPNDSDSRRR